MSVSMLLWLATAQAEEHRVEAVPSSVVVFADRARVTRKVGVDLPRGRQEITVVGLPTGVLTGTVTADAKGPGKLLGVDLVPVTAVQIADARVKEITAELEKLADQRQDVVDELNAAQTVLGQVQGSRSEAAQALDAQMLVGSGAPSRARAFRTALGTEEDRARADARDAQIELRSLEEKIASLDRERAGLGTTATDTWNAVVHVDLDKAGRVDLELSYLVGGASWVPRYDLRGDPEKGRVELSLSALVTQATGEDWRQVKLTVSSAKPGLGTVIPELDPFWLQRPQPVYAYEDAMIASSKPARSMAKMEAEDRDASEPAPEPMRVATAQVSVELAATAFSVERPEDVPADGSSRKVLLTTQNLEAKLRYVVVPRIDPRAYLVGKLTNSTDFPLLSGQAGVFLYGSYLGDFQLATVAPADTFDVAFGADDHLTVKRAAAGIEKGDKAVVGKRAKSRWSWEVKVRNGHARQVDVEVLEQIPVSTREDVKVERLPPATGTPAPTEEPGGLLKYSFSLAPQAEKAFTWGYTVDYPADIYLGWME